MHLFGLPLVLQTYVTTAFGFFSTAYTLRIVLSACLAAASEALTSGPLPAPTTINTLYNKWHCTDTRLNVGLYIYINKYKWERLLILLWPLKVFIKFNRLYINARCLME